MDELRAIFTAGTKGGLSAQKVFTDRVSEVDAFGSSAAAVLEAARSPRDMAVLNMATPRRNVLVYYGLGGIGKTALSKHLESIVSSPEPGLPLPDRRAVVRVDFGEGGELDLEAVVLSMRCGFAQLQSRWSAFDFALTRYWSRAHHGEPLPDYVRTHPRIAPGALRRGVVDQLDETARQVLRELGLAWAPARIAKTLVTLSHERLRDSRTYRKMSESCPFFSPLVEAEPSQDTLSYLPSLLSWELDQMFSRAPALPVVFLDTFEPLSNRKTREFERLVQRVVYLMPYVLFVVTSRQRLDWADLKTTTELDYVGDSRWPRLLVSNQQEPRQHLVGELSPEDCELHLRHALRRSDGAPALSAAIRRRISEASGGLPLYLDLALTQYLELVAEGTTPKPDDFGAPLPQVVANIMRHFDRESRDILRGVSLLDAFDADLAAAGAGVRDSAVLKVLHTPVVVETVGLPWPNTLHPVLRDAIRAIDHELPDAWSPREWNAAAQRSVTKLGELAIEAIARRWRATAASCFTQSLRLCAQFSLTAPWLDSVIEFLADSGMWSTFDVRLPEDQEIPAVVDAILGGLRGLALRRDGSLGEAVEQLEVALRSEELDFRLRSFFELHRAHAVRNAGRYPEARGFYERLSGDDSAYAVRARLQLADLEMLEGDFSASLETLDGLGASGEMLDSDVRGEAMRVRGHVHRVNCELEMAELAYRRALTLARMIDSPALEGKALTNLAETLCWSDPGQGGELAGEAIAFNRGLENQLEVLKAHVAAALSVRHIDGNEYAADIDAARGLVQASGYEAGEVFVLVAEAACLLGKGDLAGVDRSSRALAALTRTLGVYGFWTHVVIWWQKARTRGRKMMMAEDQLAPVRWLDPDGVQQRWANVL
jgi:tetratricopeptide (TPR) repeat protein